MSIDGAGAADDLCGRSIILHPDYSAAEIVVVGYALPYGRRFGIPFCSKEGSCKSRVISSLELLLCYFFSHRHLRDETMWLGQGEAVEFVLLGALS